MDRYDEIYYSLIGEMEEGMALERVPNAFAPGGACDRAYGRLLAARDRLLARLGVDADGDLEIMLEEMLTIQRILCREILEMMGKL